MINFAHRGFRGLYPENTMISFEKAVGAHATGIEFDVQMTKDGEFVIIHDETLDRTTDGSGYVKDHTLEELKSLSASKLYPNLEKQEIITLREYFNFAKDYNLISNVELKNSIIDYEGIEEETIRLVHEFALADNVIISSFNHNSLIKVKKIDSNIKIGVLENSILYKPWEYVKSIGAEYFHPVNTALNEEMVEKCMENDIGLNIWFALPDTDVKKYLKYNPHGIISSYPDKVNEIVTKP